MRNLIDTYLDEMLAEGKAEKTVATYRSALYRFAREIGKVLPEIASRDVHRWLMGLKGISTFRRHNVRCALAGFFNSELYTLLTHKRRKREYSYGP